MFGKWPYLVMVRWVFLMLLCTAAVSAQDLRINEVMSKNYGDFLDADGDDSDWVELYNASDTAIDLGDYFLSDDPDLLDKWSLPNETLMAGDYLVLFANGNTELDAYSMNFSISSVGETVYLSNALLTDSLEVPPLFANESYGYSDNGEPIIYSVASPNAINDEGLEEFRIDFSHPAGFYDFEFELDMGTKNPEIEIYYTLDGRNPSVSDLLYSSDLIIASRDGEPNVHATQVMNPCNPIVQDSEVEKCNIVSARAFLNGEPVSRIYRRSYFVDDAGIDRYQLPVVSIITDPDNLFDEDVGIMVPGGSCDCETIVTCNFFKDWEAPVHMEWFESGSLLYSANLGIEIHGSSSRKGLQKPFKILSKKQYGDKNIDFPFFENTERDKWDDLVFKSINSRGNDSGFSDELAHDIVIADDWNVECSAYRHFVLFLDGEYWGIYSLREKLDPEFVSNEYDIPSESLDFLRNMKTAAPNVVFGNDSSFVALISEMQELDMDDPASIAFLETHVDIDNMWDYFIVETYGGNYDWTSHNMMLFTDRDDPLFRWTFRLWDLDFAFTGPYKVFMLRVLGYEGEYLGNTFEPHPDSDQVFFYRKMLESTELRDRLLNRYIYHLQHSLCPEVMSAIVAEHEARLVGDIEEHAQRYTSVIESLDFWQNEVNRLYNFVEKRPDAIIDQLNLAFETELEYVNCTPLSINDEPVLNKPGLPLVNNALQNNSNANISIQIMNMNGQVVRTEELMADTSFSLGNTKLPAGIYLLNYEWDGNSYAQTVWLR